MSFVSGLFGGKKSSSQTGPVDVTPAEFAALRGPIADALKGLFGGPLPQGGGTPSGESMFTAPITGLENNLVNRVGGLLGQSSGTDPGTGLAFNLNPNIQFLPGGASAGGGAGGTSIGGPLRNAVDTLLKNTVQGKFLDPASNPFLSDTIRAAQRPTVEAFRDVALPRFQRGFTAAGQFIQPQGSSAFDRAAAIATRGVTNTLGDIATNIVGQNFQAERGRQVQAAEQVGQLSTADVNNTINGLQAVALPRLIEQFGINQGTTEFNRRISVVLQALGIARGLPLSVVGQQQTTQSTSSPNILGPLLGAFLAPATGGASLAAVGSGTGSGTGLGGVFG